MSEFKIMLEYLGYKDYDTNIVFGNGYNSIQTLLNSISMPDMKKLSTIPLYEVKLMAIAFFEKYFDIHDVKFSNISVAQSIYDKASKKQISELQAYREYFSLLEEVNPFDLPIELVEGHSMVGNVKKPLFTIPKKYVPSDIGIMVPFSHIELGKQLTILSPSTYIHEIAHTQQESHPGYAESFLHKEVISIFLEKVSALENDKTGDALKCSERMRFLDLARVINILTLDGKVIHLDEKERMENLMYLHSTLLAEKLFDLYLYERRQSNKDKYFYDIQDVFDGKKTVEEMLKRRNITISQARDLSLIKRHM